MKDYRIDFQKMWVCMGFYNFNMNIFVVKKLRFVFFLQIVMFFEIFRKVNFERRNVSSSVIIWLLSLKYESLAFIRTYITIKTKKKFQNLSENKKIRM